MTTSTSGLNVYITCGNCSLQGPCKGLRETNCEIDPLSRTALYFIILLCLTPDNFTYHGESAGAQWVNLTIKSTLQNIKSITPFGLFPVIYQCMIL